MNQVQASSLFPHAKTLEPWMEPVSALLNLAISQRMISSGDAAIAARVSLFGEIKADSVVLAFALAIAAPRGGSACVDLFEIGLKTAETDGAEKDKE